MTPLQADARIGEGLSGPTPGQQAVAAAIVVLAFAGVVFLYWRSQYAGLPTEQARQKSAITTERAAADLASLRVWSASALRAARDDLRALFAGEAPDRTTAREAAGEVRAHVVREGRPLAARVRRGLRRRARRLGAVLAPVRWLHRRVAALPRSVAWPLLVAIGIALTGGAAVSTRALLALLDRTPEPATAGAVAQAAIDLMSHVLTTGVAFLAAFPLVGDLVPLVTSFVILGAQLVFTHWSVPAGILLVGAASLWWLERSTPAIDPVRYRKRVGPFLTAIAAVVFVWLVGAGAAVIGRAAGYPRVGRLVALALVGVLVLVLLALGVRAYGRALDRAARRAAADGRWRVVLYLHLRRVYIGLSVLFAPLVPAYVAVGLTRVPYAAVATMVAEGLTTLRASVVRVEQVVGSVGGPLPVGTGAVAVLAAVIVVWSERERIVAALPARERSGRLTAVARLLAGLLLALVVVLVPIAAAGGAWLLAARLGPLGLGLLAVLGVLALVAYLGRGAGGAVRDAGRELLADQALRVVLGAYAFPVGAAIVAYTVLYGFLGDGSYQSILFVAALAIGVAGVGRFLYALGVRAKYGITRRAGGPRDASAGRVTVEVAPLEAGGRTLYYARLNGSTELLREDRDVLVDEIVTVGTALLETGDPPATLGQQHAQNAFEFGILDETTTAQKTREEVRRALFRTLREKDRVVDEPTLEDALADYPEQIREQRLVRELTLGNIQRRRSTIRLRNDPFA